MPRIRIDEDLLAGDDGEQEDKDRGELTFMDDDDAGDDALKLDFSDEEEEGEQEEEGDAGEGDPDEHDEEQEEEEEAVAAKKDDDDDDLSEYSKSVRKRIERERRLKEEARAELAAAKAELEQRRREERAAKIDGELDTAFQELEDARSDADVRKEAEALAKVTRLTSEKESLAEAKSTPKSGGDGPSPAYADWLKRNAWFTKPEHEVQHAATLAVAKRLVAQGLNDETPEFYERLDKELPKHIKVPRQAKPLPPRTTIERRPERGPSGRRRVVVTPQIKREMRAFGLDPKNPTHMKAYLNGDSNA